MFCQEYYIGWYLWSPGVEFHLRVSPGTFIYWGRVGTVSYTECTVSCLMVFLKIPDVQL